MVYFSVAYFACHFLSLLELHNSPSDIYIPRIEVIDIELLFERTIAHPCTWTFQIENTRDDWTLILNGYKIY